MKQLVVEQLPPPQKKKKTKPAAWVCKIELGSELVGPEAAYPNGLGGTPTPRGLRRARPLAFRKATIEPNFDGNGMGVAQN